MKRLKTILAAAGLLLLAPASSYAIPTLQLDIGGGTYDLATETIVASGDPFTLYAYLIPNRRNTLSDTYFISAAVAPKIGPPGADLGSFTFNGTTVNATADMTYGVPPIESITSLQGWDKGDLPKHGIFPTYFSELGFSFSPANQISKYNTAYRAISGDPIDLIFNSKGGMYYAAFTVDTSLFDPNYVIHFDLYNTKLLSNGDIDVSQFAPFSHDAETTSVPEPNTLILLGSGFLGLWAVKRKAF